MKTNFITSYCTIKNEEIFLNGERIFENKDANSTIDFLKNSYKHFQLAYPKFYKMDSLCKLAFLASELLIKSSKITDNYAPDTIAVIVANSSSSLEIDTEHQQTIADKKNYF